MTIPPPLDRLSAGTLDWLGRNLDYFDPFSARARTSTHGKVKAALELALLCHCWTRLDPRDDRLDRANALLRTLWQRTDFTELITAQPEYAPQYGLIYAALAPAGIDDGPRRAMLARLVAGGDLSPLGKSPYERLETRFYADKAGVDHGIESYEELIEQSPLVKPPGVTPMPATQEAYAITHSAFYVSDFGRRRPARPLADTRSLVRRMLDHCVGHDRWDLVAELSLTEFCLGGDPLTASSGAAAVECLARAQRVDGAIPARSAALASAEPLSAAESFRKAYHTTLVTGLMSLVVTSARP